MDHEATSIRARQAVGQVETHHKVGKLRECPWRNSLDIMVVQEKNGEVWVVSEDWQGCEAAP